MTSPILSFSRILLASLLLTSSVHCIHTVPHEGEEFDWRKDDVIAPVSDSRPLGDSAPYVTAECVESLLALETEHPLVILSRQQVAECCEDWPALTHGFSCITVIGGLCVATEYMSIEEICNTSSCLPVVKEIGTNYIPPNREDKMLEAILKTPLSAALDASHESFTNYMGGIYSEVNCSTTQTDHLVQIVGYGTTVDHQDYWIIKNSWGSTWGEDGYMRIVRGQNMCGIASHVFYPVLNP